MNVTETPEIIIAPVWQASAPWESYLNILDEKGIRYVVWESTYLANADRNFPEILPKIHGDFVMEYYLKSNYKVQAG